MPIRRITFTRRALQARQFTARPAADQNRTSTLRGTTSTCHSLRSRASSKRLSSPPALPAMCCASWTRIHRRGVRRTSCDTSHVRPVLCQLRSRESDPRRLSRSDPESRGYCVNETIAFLSVSDLRGLYRAKALSPIEVTHAVLDRIERLNPVLNAFTVITAELALNQARAAEQAYAAEDAAPLAGIPMSIKDLTPTRGIRTARGSLIDADWVPEDDAPVVERLYAAGAVMLGKTNTPELGWKGDPGNRVFGPSFNPWDLEKTPGGSSGGAAAAVAAGLGPLAQGSDGAGSIRIPAAFCGIFGLKQSFGLVPQYPPSAVGDLSHLGPMTRTVRDAAMMLNAMVGADARDRLSWSSGINYTRDLEAGVRGLRIAWSPTLGYAHVASDVLENTERAAMTFRELGCQVEHVDPDLPDPANILDVMWSGAMAGYFWGSLDDVGHLIDPGLLAVVERAASLSAADLANALQQRNTYYTGLREFMDFQRFNLLL